MDEKKKKSEGSKPGARCVKEGAGEVAMGSPDLPASWDKRVELGESLAQLLDSQSAGLPMRVAGEDTSEWIQAADAGEWPSRDELSLQRQQHVGELRELFEKIVAGGSASASAVEPMIETLVGQLRRFPSRFTQLALMCPRQNAYLADHAYTVAVLAMAVGAQMRWPVEHVRRVGLAGLFSDIGMLLLPQRVRDSRGALDEADRGSMQRHPLLTLALVEGVAGLAPIVKLAVLQHHERENGTGYVRGLRREAICDYARVVSAADVFSAATEPRPYRMPKLPYMAMEETVRMASGMLLWQPAVRGLLRAAGLFPVGSYLKLSDGRTAQVVASNAKVMDRPTVQPLDKEGSPSGTAVDLAEATAQKLTVVRPLASAAA